MSNSVTIRFLVFLTLVSVPIILLSQNDDQLGKLKPTVIQGHAFATVALIKGLPNFPPIKRRFAAEEQYATLQFADTLGTLYVCCGKGSDGHWLYCLLHHRHDQNWSMSPVDFNEDHPDTLRTFFDLTPLTGRETPFPMDLRIVLSSRVLLFRWLLSPDYPTIAGGIPTPANVLLDVGKPLFDFTVSDLSGRQVRSSELRTKITVVDWWSTSCTACIAEMPGYNKLVLKYTSKVDFVAIAMNTNAEVKAFLPKHEFLFRQTVTSDSMFQLIGSGIPRTVVLNEHGIVTFDRAGGGTESYKEVEKAIDALLAK